MASERITINSSVAKKIYEARKNTIDPNWKAYKKEACYSQLGLADAIGIEEKTYRRVEGCRLAPDRTYTTTFDTMEKIVKKLGLTLEELLKDESPEYSKEWFAITERWHKALRNNEPWFTCESSSAFWDGAPDNLIVSCNKYPVKELILAICAHGGRHLIDSAIADYDSNKVS